jgi:hypothetical protein
MLPKQLTGIIETADYVEYDLRIRKIDLSTDLMKVDFTIHDTEGSGEHKYVVMTLSRMTDFFITKNDYSGYSHFETEHPLLWRFSDTQCELYITGQTKEVKQLIFDLFTISHSLFANYLSFDPSVLTILNNGHGLFQKGPKKLLKMYADKLNQYGIKTSIISEFPADRHDADLKILFLGKSYFVADDFQFEVRN